MLALGGILAEILQRYAIYYWMSSTLLDMALLLFMEK
jgi:hypothetical protein